MASFRFELVSPERLLFSGEVEEVVVPGTEGEFTVLKDHAPLMSTLKPGIIDYAETSARRVRLYVRGGFADVAASGLTILADSAVPVDAMNAAALDTEAELARAELASATDGEGRRLAQEKVDQVGELRVALRA